MKVLMVLSIIALSFTLLGCQGAEDEVILPKVVEISPADGEYLIHDPSGGLKVVFNKPMAVETVQITVGGIAGKITFNETHTEFVWSLQKLKLLSSGPHLVMIQGKDEDGNPLEGYQPITVHVVQPEIEPVRIVRTDPPLYDLFNLDVETQKITVFFNGQIDPSESTVSVTSQEGIPIRIEVLWRPDSVEILFQDALEPQTTYTVVFRDLIDQDLEVRNLEFQLILITK